MKPLTLLLLFGLFFSLNVQAQKPWRAKLFVHFLDSNNQIVTDTVWFGADSLGDVGYQLGLDVIDTNVQWNKVYSSDELIKVQYNTDCANLKTNIIKFEKGNKSFKFFASGYPIALSWDSIDFKYNDSIFKITYLELTSFNGYIFGTDRQVFRIIGDSYRIVNGDYVYVGSFVSQIDSIRIIKEMSLISDCRTKNEFFEFSINLIMGPRFGVGIAEINANKEFIVYPNPFNNSLTLKSNLLKKLTKLRIYNSAGRLVIDSYINGSDMTIETTALPPGVYYINFSDDVSTRSKPLKLIKL